MQGPSQKTNFRPTVALIDLDAIAANFRTLEAMVDPGAFFCPMVKANAYGHGAGEVARALREAGARHLGVATIEEGLDLRMAGDRGEILVFGLFHDAAAAREVLERKLTPVVSAWEQLQELDRAAPGGCEIHLKFNTGMNRLGFAVGDAARLRQWLDDKKKFRLAGLCTHFLRGDDVEDSDSETRRQFQNFVQALQPFVGLGARVHALNSAAIVACRRGSAGADVFDRGRFGVLGARPGIAIYGAQPSDRPELRLDLKPVMTLKSQTVTVNRVKKGGAVSYGGTWRASRDSWIAVVPVGYGDGVFRSLSNRGSVLCRGSVVPIAGVVCMDYIMIDMTDIVRPGETPAHGDEVVLLGRQGMQVLSADDVARLVGTIPYEVFTRMGERVPRVFQRPSSGDGKSL